MIGLDRNDAALRLLPEGIHRVRADLEAEARIPIATGACAAVLVFRFLFRPLSPEIERILRPGGILLYETFTRLQGKLPHGPGNPAFLLDEGELGGLFPGLRTEVLREGRVEEAGRPWETARLLARKPT